MKNTTAYALPMVLGILVTGCSTQSTQQDAGVYEFISSRPATSTQDTGLSERITSNAKQKNLLEEQLASKEREIADLLEGDTDAASLRAISALKQEREVLEHRYNEVLLQNDKLNAQIQTLREERDQAVEQRAAQNQEFMELNKDFRTVESARYALSKDYRDLSLKHAELKSQHKILVEQREQLRQTLKTLKQENEQLGGQLSDARAQHQVLWDKIRVQSNMIDTLESDNASLERSGRLVSASDSANGSDKAEVDTSAQLRARIARLEAEIDAQNTIIRDYQADAENLSKQLTEQQQSHTEALQALQQRYDQAQQRNGDLSVRLAELRAELNAKDQRISVLEQQLESGESERQSLQQRLAELREQHERSEATVAQLEARAQEQAQSRAQLENQVNKLIPFEGAVSSLQRQLESEVDNARWSLPTSANLNDTFEIQFSADIDNPVEGQVFFAELIVDSALSMMSAPEAESVVENGQINFRWRLSGLNERPNATMNIAVTQNVNYDGQQILRKVYRDSETVELISTDWLGKYGYWGVAILGALFVGFGAARIGRTTRDD